MSSHSSPKSSKRRSLVILFLGPFENLFRYRGALDLPIRLRELWHVAACINARVLDRMRGFD